MDPLALLYMVLLGLAVGSFLNVVVLRTERGVPLTGRSACPRCDTTLSWYELVPVISYLVQQGRCRTCRCAISVQYPLVELGTGLVFLLVGSRAWQEFGTVDGSVSVVGVAVLGAHAVAWSALIAITVYDLKTKLIPDLFSIVFGASALVVGLLTLPTYDAHAVLLHLAAGPLIAAPFALLWLVSKGRWLGLGDAQLALGIGWLLGVSGGLAAVMIAFWIGAAVGLSLVFWGRVREAREGPLMHVYRLVRPLHAVTMKSEVPFAPFLAVGTLLTYVYSLTFWTITDAIGRFIAL